MSHKILFLSLIAVSSFTPSVCSAALLEGRTVQSTYFFPDTSTVFAGPENSVVGAGLELTIFAGLASVNFSDTNILITLARDSNVNNVVFDGFRFADTTNSIPTFGSVTLNAATNYAGFSASRITFDANNIYVNVANLAGLRGQVISIDIADTSNIPEPSSVSLLAMGACALALSEKRRIFSAFTNRKL